MSDLAAVRKLLGERPRSLKARREYLVRLWSMHDWMEREIIGVERAFTDKELDVLLDPTKGPT